MIKIAIVEDDKRYAQQLEKYLRKYEKDNKENFILTFFENGNRIVDNYQPNYDIILMDVVMPIMDGMSAAIQIREIDTTVIIIFITNISKYLEEGYEVQALYYLTKPVDYFKFSERMSKAVNAIKRRTSKDILLNIKGGNVLRFKIKNIYYVESQRHTLIYHTASGVYQTSGTMKDTEKRLEEEGFFRGSKSYLINLAYVEGIQEGCAMVGDQKLALSRTKKSLFMEALTNYCSEAQ